MQVIPFSTSRSGNGGNGGGGGSFLSYLQEQTGSRLIPVTDQTQAWVGSQPKTRQAVETMMSSVCNAMDGDPSHMSPEALLQPVRDMGHSEILRGHFRGTQPFEKGLGFPHRVPELRAWDDVRLKGQVSVSILRLCVCVCYDQIYKISNVHSTLCAGIDEAQMSGVAK